MKKKERGFTLIELLVVIAILGVLAAVAVPRVLGAVENSRRNANLANQAIVQSAVERYQIEHARWPLGASPGQVDLPSGTATTLINQALLTNFLQGGRLPSVREVDMRLTGTPNNIVVTPAFAWHLNSAGVVVLVGGAGPIVWVPTP